MKVRFSLTVFLSVGFVTLGILAGCGQDAAQLDNGDPQQEEIDPHDVPLTDEQKQQMREEAAKLADAVAMIKQFRDTVEQETHHGLPDNPFDVHQALDKTDFLVQLLPEIARDSGVPKEHWETVNTAANELRGLFEQVHQNIDDKADPGFASVQEQIDAKIGELEAIGGSLPADG